MENAEILIKENDKLQHQCKELHKNWHMLLKPSRKPGTDTRQCTREVRKILMENKKLKTQELKTKIERALWFTEMFAFSEKEKKNRFKDLPEVEQKMIKQIVFITLFQR